MSSGTMPAMIWSVIEALCRTIAVVMEMATLKHVSDVPFTNPPIIIWLHYVCRLCRKADRHPHSRNRIDKLHPQHIDTAESDHPFHAHHVGAHHANLLSQLGVHQVFGVGAVVYQFKKFDAKKTQQHTKRIVGA